MCKWDIATELADRIGIKYMKDYASKFDLRALHTIRQRYIPYKYGVWGFCYPPRPNGKTLKTVAYFRITSNVGGYDGDYPNPWRYYYPPEYGGYIRPECVCENLDELIVVNIAHELYHYLAFAGQVPGNWLSEPSAVAHSYTVLNNYRKEVRSES